MSRKVAVIGGGFAGLSAASHLAKAGCSVTLLEKNSTLGGRARKFETQGFTFDMGPSWYWMPDVFQKYFESFGSSPADHYDLIRLDPSYRIFFSKEEIIDIPAGYEELLELFENLESGAAGKLEKFLKEAEIKYKVGIQDLVYKPGLSLAEYLDHRVISGVFNLHLFQDVASYVRRHFKHPSLVQMLEFPVLFLGAMPSETPALYTLMNYADIKLGTWYPQGGMNNIIKGMESVAKSLGVEFLLNSEISAIEVINDTAVSVERQGEKLQIDAAIAAADYHHVETSLLPEGYRNYSERYWQSRVMAPSSLIFYLGIDKKLQGLLHHNLFFDQSFSKHAEEIYKNPQWPSNPLFYVCCPSITDDSVAPANCENLFILIPVAPGLEDSKEIRDQYFQLVMERLESLTGQSIKEHILVEKSYAHKNFIEDYHSFKGNAYGLANTLKQTAILKPSLKNKRVSNLFYAGQLTVPGPGVPPSIISGEVAAKQLLKTQNKTWNEITV